jgi:thioredoxin-dependent peroxiredoxin
MQSPQQSGSPKAMSESIPYGKGFSLKSTGRTVLYFYPRDNTPGCTTQAKDFTAQSAKFKKLGVRVVGVSQDSVASHEKFREKQGLNLLLLSDEGGELCKRFDVIKEKSLYGRKFLGIERSTFVLGKDGKVQKEWRKVKVPGHVEEVLAYLKESE